MAGLTLKGAIVFKGQTETIKDDFTKRELWLEIDRDTQYKQTINIEFIKDKTSLVDKYNVGDEVEVDVNIRGNRVTLKKDNSERCFNAINGWRIRGMASGDSEPVAATPNAAPDADPDDLPF